MDKTHLRAFRMPPTLSEQVDIAATERGMNFSEFMRYVLNVFFDRRVGNSLPPVDPSTTYETEPAP